MFRGKVRHIHFIGIGGSGMNGIAQVLLNQGFSITGSDIKKTPTIEKLIEMGAKVFIGHKPDNVNGADVIVYSSAVSMDNVEIKKAKQMGIPIIPRGEMLAELMRFKYGIAIAGSHGKTTTTSMLGTILAKTGHDPTVVIGGRLEAFGSNAKLGRGEFIVTESDESDGSFLRLTPTIVSINNIDVEHIGFYKSLDDIKEAFVQFANKVPFYGAVALNIDDQNIQDILPKIEKKVIKFGLSQEAEVKGHDIKLINGRYSFKVNELGEIHLSIPGKHNIYNALASISIALELNVPFCVIKESLENFKNANRRFDIKFLGDIAIIDDYAHHPTEIKATIYASREMFPNRRLVVVFQPHRYSRVFSLFDQFVDALSIADQIILTDIYPAGEENIYNVTGDKLYKAIKKKNKNVTFVKDIEEALEILPDMIKKQDVLLTLGAGNITKLADKLSSYYQSLQVE
ncbi:MAG: UDP-N-acetylmuramate--L-alanine ligase [Aquificae bacterium]|nr:UDP-N-acetylmuramate--L-alanine ligase [Aquificota bacterium]